MYKIKTVNFSKINKISHNLLSFFVVLSLIFNPFLHNIPVAEATVPAVPRAPSLAASQDDSRSAYTVGESDNKIKLKDTTIRGCAVSDSLVTVSLSGTPITDTSGNSTVIANGIDCDGVSTDGEYSFIIGKSDLIVGSNSITVTATDPVVPADVSSASPALILDVDDSADITSSDLDLSVGSRATIKGLKVTITAIPSTPSVSGQIGFYDSTTVGDAAYKFAIITNTSRESYGVKTETDGSQTKDTDNANTAIAPTAGNPRFSHDNNPNPFILVYTDGQTNEQIVDDLALASRFLDDGKRFEITDNGNTFDIFASDEDIKNIDTYSIRESGGFTATTVAATKSSEKVSDTQLPSFLVSNVEANSVVELYLWEDSNTDTVIDDNELDLIGLKEETTGSLSTITVRVGDDVSNYTPSVSGKTVNSSLLTSGVKEYNIVTKIVDAVGNISDFSDITNIQLELAKTDTPTSVDVYSSDVEEVDTGTGFPVITSANNESITITGTTEAGSTVYIRNGIELLASEEVSSTSFSIDVSLEGNETYTLSITASKPGKIESDEVSLSLIVISVGPNLSIIESSPGQPALTKDFTFEIENLDTSTDYEDRSPTTGYVLNYIGLSASDACDSATFTDTDFVTDGGLTRNYVKYDGVFTAGSNGGNDTGWSDSTVGNYGTDPDPISIDVLGASYNWRAFEYNSGTATLATFISLFSTSNDVADVIDTTSFRFTNISKDTIVSEDSFSNRTTLNTDTVRTAWKFDNIDEPFVLNDAYMFSVFNTPVTYIDSTYNGTYLCARTEDRFGNETIVRQEVKDLDITPPTGYFIKAGFDTADTTLQRYIITANDNYPNFSVYTTNGTEITADTDFDCLSATFTELTDLSVPVKGKGTDAINKQKVCLRVVDAAGNRIDLGTGTAGNVIDGAYNVTLASEDISYTDAQTKEVYINKTTDLSFSANTGVDDAEVRLYIVDDGEAYIDPVAADLTATASGGVVTFADLDLSSFDDHDGKKNIFASTNTDHDIRYKIMDLILDTQAPQAPQAPTLTNGSDTYREGFVGSTNTDRITKDTQISITGCAEANSTLKVYTRTNDDPVDVYTESGDEVQADGEACVYTSGGTQYDGQTYTSTLSDTTLDGDDIAKQNFIVVKVFDLVSNESDNSGVLDIFVDKGIDVTTSTVGLQTDSTTTTDHSPEFKVTNIEKESFVELYIWEDKIQTGETDVDGVIQTDELTLISVVDTLGEANDYSDVLLDIGHDVPGYTPTTGLNVDSSNLSEGEHILTAVIVDVVGNESGYLTNSTFTFVHLSADRPADLSFEAADYVTIFNDTYYTNQTTNITLTGITQRDNTVKALLFNGTDYDELTPTQTPTVSSGGLFSIELPEFTSGDGNYTLTAQASSNGTDFFQSNDDINLTIDQKGPVFAGHIEDENGSHVDNTTTELSVTIVGLDEVSPTNYTDFSIKDSTTPTPIVIFAASVIEDQNYLDRGDSFVINTGATSVDLSSATLPLVATITISDVLGNVTTVSSIMSSPQLDISPSDAFSVPTSSQSISVSAPNDIDRVVLTGDNYNKCNVAHETTTNPLFDAETQPYVAVDTVTGLAATTETIDQETSNGTTVCYRSSDGTATTYRFFNVQNIDTTAPDLDLHADTYDTLAQEKTYYFTAADINEPQYGFIFEFLTIPDTASITDIETARSYCTNTVGGYNAADFKSEGGLYRHELGRDSITNEEDPIYDGTFTSKISVDSTGFKINADESYSYGEDLSDKYIEFGGSRHLWRELAYNENGIFYVSFHTDESNDYLGTPADDTRLRVTDTNDGDVHFDNLFSTFSDRSTNSVGEPRTIFKFTSATALEADIPYRVEVFHDPVTFDKETDNGKYLCVGVSDAAGVEAWEAIEVQNIDTTYPTITVAQSNNAYFAGSNEEVSASYLKTSDTTIDDKAACASATGYTSYTLLEDITIIAGESVCFTVTDIAGNTTYAHSSDAIEVLNNLTLYQSDGTTLAPGTFGDRAGTTSESVGIIFTAANGGPEDTQSRFNIHVDGSDTYSLGLVGLADDEGNLTFDTDDGTFPGFTEGDWDIYTETRVVSVWPGPIKIYDLKVDLTDPLKPAAATLDPSTDTSRSVFTTNIENDSITKAEDIKITGCAETGATVSTFINTIETSASSIANGEVTTCTVEGEAEYEITIPASELSKSATGEINTITVQATDESKRKSPVSDSIDVTVDSAVDISSTASISIKGTTSDNTGQSNPTLLVSGIEENTAVEVYRWVDTSTDGVKDTDEVFLLGAAEIPAGENSVDVVIGSSITDYVSTRGKEFGSSPYLVLGQNIIFVDVSDVAGNETKDALSPNYNITLFATNDKPENLAITNAASSRTANSGEVTYYINTKTGIELTGIATTGNTLSFYDDNGSITPNETSVVSTGDWTATFDFTTTDNRRIYATSTPSGSTTESDASQAIFLQIDETNPTFSVTINDTDTGKSPTNSTTSINILVDNLTEHTDTKWSLPSGLTDSNGNVVVAVDSTTGGEFIDRGATGFTITKVLDDSLGTIVYPLEGTLEITNGYGNTGSLSIHTTPRLDITGDIDGNVYAASKTIILTSDFDVYKGTGNNVSNRCNTTDESLLSFTLVSGNDVFNSEADNGTEICYRTSDGTYSIYKIITINGIDTTGPTVAFNVDSVTGENANIYTLDITDISSPSDDIYEINYKLLDSLNAASCSAANYETATETNNTFYPIYFNGELSEADTASNESGWRSGSIVSLSDAVLSNNDYTDNPTINVNGTNIDIHGVVYNSNTNKFAFSIEDPSVTVSSFVDEFTDKKITIIDSSNNSIFEGDFNQATLSVEGTPTYSQWEFETTGSKLNTDGGFSNTEIYTITIDGSFSQKYDGSNDGDYLCVKVKDDLDNYSYTSIEIDATDPIITFSSNSDIVDDSQPATTVKQSAQVVFSVDETSGIVVGGSCAAEDTTNLQSVSGGTEVTISLVNTNATPLTNTTTYTDCTITVTDINTSQVSVTTLQNFTIDADKPLPPSVESLTTVTDTEVTGLSTNTDNITKDQSISVTGCSEADSNIFAYDITIDGTTTQISTNVTADGAVCTWTPSGESDQTGKTYTLTGITTDITSSSKDGVVNNIGVYTRDVAGNTSLISNTLDVTIDGGVVNFGDDVTISNSGSDYYISADDEGSKIKYSVTTEDKTSTTTATCDNTLSYTDYDSTTGVSSLDSGVEKQICFEVEDSNSAILYYNSKTNTQDFPVLPNIDSASNSGDTTDNITNNTKPSILVSNVEGLAAVEIYTWSDDASTDNLIQESELTLRGVTQNSSTSAANLIVSWGNNINTNTITYTPTINNIPTDNELSIDGTYYFTSRVVDFVGNTSPFTPVSSVVINTTATDTITLEANTNIITTSTIGVNYINKTNLAKDANNNLVTLSNPSGLSNVGYADIQASTITCTDLLDTDFTNTDIATTETTTLTDGSSYQVCARAEDSNGNAIYASFAFTIDTTEPSTPTVDTPTDKAVSGLSISSDGITEKGDITITGCALENTDVYAQITADSITTQASTFTTANDTATTCTDTGHDGYSLTISTSDLTSSRAGTENAITVSSFDDAGNESAKPTGFTFEIDDGVVNFGDDVTISNSGSDYYISADDEDSSIKYSVTTEDKTSTTTATCDNTLSYTDYDSTTGVSSLDSGVEKQICFEVEDSSLAKTYYNSKTYEQDFPVISSLDSASNSGDTTDNITNNTKPSILVSNVEGNAAVEIYTWSDDASADNLIQESELILRGFKQNGTSVGGVTVSWGSNSNTSPTHFNDNYVPTLTIDTDALSDGTHYFTSRVVDFVGNTSQFTPVSQVVINTQVTTVNSIELSPNTYPSQFGSSELSDNITKESDIRLTVCVESGSTLTLKDELDTTINSTITEDTADTATCTVTGDSKFTIDITSGTLQSSPSGDTHNLHVDIENTAGTTSDGLNSPNAQISITLDSGVSNFTDIATISNKGTDYYITAYDEGSTINYFVTTEDKSSTTIVTCDSSLTYSNGYNGTGVSSLDSGVEKQICFEVTDSNITTPSISYHNSKAAEQTPVDVSVNSGGYFTNNTKPNITPTNIEEGAFVEIYTWSDDTSADGLVQASELTLHGVTQFTAGVTDVLWGSEVTNYTTSENKTIDSTDLVDNTTYKFVVRVVDLAGYVSSFTPPVDIKVDTTDPIITFSSDSDIVDDSQPATTVKQSAQVVFSVDETSGIVVGGSCAAEDTTNLQSVSGGTEVTISLVNTDATPLTNTTTYTDCTITVTDINTSQVSVTTLQNFTIDADKPLSPSVESLTTVTDTEVTGLSTNTDNITKDQSISVTGCSEADSNIFAYDITIDGTTAQISTNVTADGAVCTWTPSGESEQTGKTYTLTGITTDITSSSKDGVVNNIGVYTRDVAGNTSLISNTLDVTIDDGVVNFGDDVTISNSGSDYYISADDEGSKIKYSVTTEDKTSATTATCDNTLSYTDYDSTTGVSSLDSGVEKQICFEVEDSSLAKTYYNSKTYEQDFPVISSLDSASNSGDTTDNITNNTKPSILVSNVEGLAAVEIYTWSDDASADNLIQESELTLRGVTQNSSTSATDVTASWENNINTNTITYTPTLTIDTTELSDETHYFTSRVIDFVGNTSPFTPVSQVVINTQATDTITLEANTNIITTSTSGVNYINKTNLAKDAGNNLVTLSNPSGLSNVGYADIQASTITCTDLLDTDFTNTDIPTTKTTSFTDGSSYQVCARATDIHDNPVYSSFAFTIDITEPSTPTVDTPADKAVSGLSISSDGITEKGDITITGCALENTDVYAQITADSITTQASTFTTANDTTTGCIDTDHDGYSLIISTSDLTSSRAGTENAITVSSFDDAGNESAKPTGFTFEIDDGVVNFGDDVTISNSGSDYYISADDEDSTIKYLVTSSLVADSVVDCSTQTYTEAYVGVGISNIVDNAGTDENRQICFEVTDSNSVISHYNSIEDTQTSSVLPSLDSASNSGDTTDNITNNTKPNILVSNVEGLAAVEIYTWSDDTPDDNLIQESELTLRGVTQNSSTSAANLIVSWGNNINTNTITYTPTINNIPTDNELSIDGTYYFTSRVVDFVGNKSPFTPISQVVINTQATDTITLEANTNIITTSTSGVNYINKTNLEKDADNNLVTLSNPSGLSNVGYADIQANTITCTDLLDTDFTNTDIPTTETTSFTDGDSHKVCARVEDSNGNAIYASFAFTIDTTEPSTPTLDIPADKAVSGLSISSDGITEKGDITITGCALENTDVYAQITADSITTQASTFTTANDTTTTCIDTDHDGYSLIISTSDLTSSRAGTENAITVSSFDDAGNESAKPTGFTFEIDDGVVNFGDDVTISNSGSDYYISADDEGSKIKYSVTTEDKTSATTATCDNTLSYTDYVSTTGVSSLDSGVEKQICFEVEDSSLAKTYYNSKTYEQDFPVISSLDSASNSGDTADNITNNTKPNILVSNVEGLAAVEIYTWSDNTPDDNLIQESELTLRGVTQNSSTSAANLIVSWGNNINTNTITYTPTLTIDTTELPDETYYFTARAVDFVGNTSPFTPVSQVVINTQATTVNSIELSPNTYPSQFGSSELSDNITKESDIRLTVCVESGSTLTLKDELDTTINSTITEDTADTATCTVTGDSKFTIDITSGTLQSSPSGDTHNLHVDIENTAGTTSDGLNSPNAQISITLDSGVSNFTDIATISNKGTDYYITAYDEGSTINYFVTTEDKSSTTIVTCDSSLTYSNGYNGTGVSSLDSGVEKQICFEVTDSNITTPSISYHNSKAAEQTPVAVSVNSGGFVTNDITPNITPTNIEEGAFVEVYTWSDDTSADGLVQASELTLHGVTQFTAGVTDVLWGSEVTNYTTSENKTIDSTDLVDNTTYKFVVRVVDLAGYVSSFTPPVDIKVDTAETLIEFTANTNLIYTNADTSINYINKQGKNYSSIEAIASVDQTGLDLSSLKYSNLQSSTTDCAADLTDTDYSLSNPFTNDTSGGLFESVFAESTTYTLCAKALNLANTPSYASFVFTVDTTESKQVTSIDLLESSDSSRDAYPNGLTDNITNNTTLVFNVCAESDNLLTINNSTDDLTSILVTEDTTDTTTCTTQGDAKYDVTISASTLTSNQNSLYIDLTDSAGNYTDGSTTTIDVVLDTEVTLSPKPTLLLTSPNQFDSTKVNSSTPGISVSDVEANAVIELYQWKDEVQAGETDVDGVIQTNELILKSIQASTQSTSSSVDVIFGNTIFGYTTTTLKTVDRDVLSGTDNKFTAIIVDAAGNFSTTDDVDVLSFDVEILGNPPTELYVDTLDYNTIYNNAYYTHSESGITIKGKGKAGETINVYKDANTNTLGSTTIANGQNKWEIDISLTESNTLYQITATSEFGGIESSKSNPIYLYVDITSPFTPNAASIKAGDDTGRPISDQTSSTDYYTTDNHTQFKDLYFNGCAEENSEIKIDLDNIILPLSATADGADCTDSNSNPGKEFEFMIEKEYFSNIKPVSNIGTNFILKIISIDRSGNSSISQTGDGYLTLILDSGTPTGFSKISLLSGFSSIVFVTNEKRPTFNITNTENDSIVELYDWNDLNFDGIIDQNELTTIGTVETGNTGTGISEDLSVKYGDYISGYTSEIKQLTETEISNGLSDGEYVVTATVIDKVGNIPNPKYVAASDFRIASIEGTPTGLSVHVDSYSTLQNYDEYFTNNQYINIRGYAPYIASGDTPPVKLSQIKIYNDGTSATVNQYICTSPSDTTTCTLRDQSIDPLLVEENNEWNTYVKLPPSTDTYILYATVTNITTTPGTESNPSTQKLSINVEDLVPTPPTKPIVNSSHIEVDDGSDTHIYHSLKPVNLKGCAIPNSRLFVYLNKGTTTPTPEIDALSIEVYADSPVVCDLDNDGVANDGLEYDVVIPIDVLRTDDYRRSNSFKVTSRTKGGSDSVPSDDTVVNIDSAVKGISPLSTKRISASLHTESDSGSSNTDLITSDTTPKFEVKNVEARSYVELYLWSDLNDNNTPDDNDSLILVAEQESSTIFPESTNKSNVYTVDIEFGNDETGHTVENKVIDSSYTLSDGYHNFAIQIVDKVGNTSGYISVSDTILIETQKPTADVNDIGLTNNPILEVTSTVNTDTTVSFVTGGSCGFEASAETQLAAGAVLIIELVDQNFLELEDGTYNDCEIVLTSVVDVVSDNIAIPSFTVDTNPSTVAEETGITDPTNNPVVTISSTEEGTISFTGGCVPIENGIVVTDPDIIVGNNEIIFDTSGLTSGTTYTCVATVTDLAGNTSNLTLSSFVFDNTLPELTEETAVTTPSTTTDQPEVVISSNEDGTLTFSGTAGCENNNTTGITASTNTTVTFDPLDDGTYDCIAFVTDGANNTSAPLNLTQFVVETKDPTVISTILDEPGVTQGKTFDVKVSFSELVQNVDTTDFDFIKTDNTDPSNPTTSSVGTIKKVEAFDELFDTSTGDSTDDTTTTTTISGRYFLVSVEANSGIKTEADITFAFSTLSTTTSTITDSSNKSIDLVNSGTDYTVAVDINTSTPSITNAIIVDSKLVLTSPLEFQNSSTTTGGGGFVVTGSDSTVYTIDSVNVSGFTITITFDSLVTPASSGTYSYLYDNIFSITTTHGVSLGDITDAVYEPDFSLDFDGVDGYTSNEGLFLYLKTQKAYTPGPNTLTGLLASPSLLGTAEANVAAAIAGPKGSFLDLDGVDGYTSNEGLFLYLKTQKAYTPGSNTFTGLLASPSLLGTAEARIVVLIEAAKKD